MTVATLEGVDKLRRDLREAAGGLGHREARYLVDAYYTLQHHRIEAQNQVRALTANEEPNAVIAWLLDQHALLENEIKKALGPYTDAHVAGQWAKSITGIGPVLAAGLLAHIDMEPFRCMHVRVPRADGVNPYYDPKATACNEDEPHGPECARQPLSTVGQIWRFAGLDPTVAWERGQKRPWNAQLKVLCWKIGESFVKVASRESDVYGKVYVQRKQIEEERNASGLFADQAAAALENKKYGKTTEAYKAYAAGRLPQARIHARAKRYAVKLYLSAFHEVSYFATFGELPPKPYVLEHLGHAHYIAPPNLDMVPGLREARAAAGI